MGNSTYSSTDRLSRSVDMGYQTKSAEQLFTSRNLDIKMNPKGVMLREARDSDTHPNSVPIILALDVTGSMGRIPHYLVSVGLPNIMSKIMEVGIADPQILFMGIGDHKVDRAPLQISQFESGDAELDKWLTETYLEGGGGGNHGESYFLPWYFAANRTVIDSFEKRGKKGLLFTVGDEPLHMDIGSQSMNAIMGGEENGTLYAIDMLEDARKLYDVYHLHIRQGQFGTRQSVMDGWKEIMGDNLVIVKDAEDVARIIPEIVAKHFADSEAILNTSVFVPVAENKQEVVNLL